MADLNKALQDSADGPASVTVDGQTQTEHALPGKIAAVKFAMATRARSRSPLAGVSLSKLAPHGAQLPNCTDGSRGSVGL